MKYHLNEYLLTEAGEILSNRKNIYWILGGGCAGKSTISKRISEKYGLLLYDMDEYIYGKYISRYSEELYPANTAWFTADNPMDWALSFPTWEENNDFYIAATAEHLHLFSEDIKKTDQHQSILVDGGITNPAILAKVLSPQQICCIKIDNQLSNKIWEESPERQPMKEMILQLPCPQDKWKKFLSINESMNQQIEAECRESNIKIFFRDDKTTVEEMAQKVSNHFLKGIL
ncbi:hypothetical protein SAMN05660297_02126 [Natronincola peptidivorans]|uniref:Shikimate kinase n=1 Tax=Natronincola peptidivorans TaxID=426128 RepID=A0A1I0DRS0_9FIRM|nr:hypothetical protein [Natronincola peptidivorans]SET34629.1 hypothetical protein SAMN05660297_02126 [Natronincola peptidivorans]